MHGLAEHPAPGLRNSDRPELRENRTDAFLVKKIVASATAFFDDVRNDPKHPFRGEFDRMVLSFVDKLGSDQAYADRVDGLKRGVSTRSSPRVR